MDRLLQKYVLWNLKFWWLNLILAGALTFSGLIWAKRVSLDSDLESLLPKKSDTVVNMNSIQEKSGGSQDLKIILSGGPLENRVEAAEAFVEFLSQKYPDFARSIRYKTPKPFFEEHKFKLIPPESLDSILKKISQERKKNAAIVDPLGLESVEDGSETEIADAQSARTGAENVDAKDADEDLDKAKDLLKRLDEMRPYYETADGTYLAIRVLPKMESYNIEKNRQILKSLKAIVNEFNFEKFDSQIRTEIYGTIYNHIVRFDSIKRDVGFGIIGVLLILLIVGLYFRSAWSLLATVPPLITGLAIGMGIVGLLEGALNSIAIFLVLVVFGIGIEFGIHLWSRYLQERKTRPLKEALDATWRSTGRATLTSSTALLCGFGLLCLSSFQGFAQFGRVAIILVVCASGSFVFFMPSWILCVERLRSERAWTWTLSEWLVHHRFKRFWTPRNLLILRWGSIVLLIASTIMCARFFRFDYGFEETVSQKNMPAGRRAISDIFSERLTPSAVAVFQSQEEAGAFMNYYRLHQKNYPEIPLMSGLSSFLPLDQDLRIRKLQEIADDLEPEWIRKFEDPHIRDALTELKEKAYEQRAIVFDDIPSETREPFLASDGSGDHLVFLFDKGGATDGLKAMRFRAEAERLIAESKLQPLFSGNQIIFADIVNRVTREGPLLVLGMFLLVFMICWIDFRNFKDALITMGPVIFGFLLTGLILVLQGVMINFFNMVALASLGAMVVDNSIHLFHRFKEMKDNSITDPDHQSAMAVAPPIFVCTLTSICGYGGMAFARHNGIASLGWVAIVGLLACFVSSVFFFPAWLNRIRARG